MAKQVFKQFKQVTSAFTEWENGVLYFVRTAADKGDGFVRFNGKIYGSGEEVKALIGELPSGQTDIATWIESVSAAITTEAAARAAVDATLLGDATASTTTNATIYDVKRAVDAIAGSSHSHSNLEVLNGITAEKVAAWDDAEQNAKDYADSAIAELDASVSGASNGVEVQVVEADGKITAVNVTAPDFDNTYDAKGAADEAYSAATGYTDTQLGSYATSADTVAAINAAYSAATAETASQITTAINAETARTESTYAKPADITAAIEDLDATVSGESAEGVAVEIAQVNGVITGVTVTGPDLSAVYDEKGAAASAETAAKSYADGLIAAETARTEGAYAKPADITTAIENLDATVSGASNGVEVEVVEADGVITTVNVTAPDFANTYDVKGAAASAETAAKAYTDSALTAYATSADTVTALGLKQDALTFNSTPSEQNWVATRDDIADIAGAMHFVGTATQDPSQGDPAISGHTGEYAAGDVCLYGTKEYIYNGSSWVEIGDEGIYVTKTTTIAGVDLQDNITKAELLSALTVEEGAQVNVVETIKVNGTAITVTDKAVDIAIEEGSSAGTISVAGVNVPVHGLGSMAFENAADFAAASSLTALSGAVESAITELEGEIDSASAATYNAATAYTDSQISSAIGNLDATVSGASSGNVTTVEVVEADGVITAVNVSNNLSADANNALSVKSDGLFAAIYYEDDDNE